MFSYFGAQYLTTVNLVVPEEYRSLAETIKQQIERQPRPTVNLEVLSDEDYAKRIKDGKWELTVMSMDGTDDAAYSPTPIPCSITTIPKRNRPMRMLAPPLMTPIMRHE